MLKTFELSDAMEKLIHERYTDAIKAEALRCFHIKEEELKPLGGFESFLYEYPRDGEAAVLRVSHTARYSLLPMLGELDFLRYLREHGANVASSLSSPAGSLLEAIDDGHDGQFLVTAFEKAAGGHQRGDWSDEFMQHYGETIGRLHRLSSSYTPSNPDWTRSSWDAPKALNYDEWLLGFDAEVHEKFRANLAYIRALPKDSQSYGMIHQDAHAGNFYVQDGKITLFDFADCCYGYFVNDIAMVLLYSITGQPKADPAAFIRHFFSQFWKGYAKEFSLQKRWLSELPYFFKLREIDLYAVIERDTNWRNGESAWLTNFMTSRRERILNELPYIDVDFAELA
jgi:Ser/Thr protein kinase RdoA (MazF antagonist)